jgi:S-adenosyl-L-methionine hydrolase (adenosine-forming)
MATSTGPLTGITLLTDFGTRDGYVGALKGVLASRAPEAAIHDIAHDIPPGDVAAGARALERYWSWWPRGTVHLVVVDPGVGTERAPLAAEAEGRFLVGPDNGVGTPLLRATGSRVVRLHPALHPGSATFHGRDLFAPAAASLAAGTPLDHLGPELPHPVLLPWETTPGPRGRIVAWDHFGNLQTDLVLPPHGPPSRVRVGGVTLPLLRTYGDVDSGEPLALVDSQGRLEIAVRDGSARARFGWEAGQVVELEPV